MQSKEEKILNLINSNDSENNILGFLLLKEEINSENVVYWNITLDKILPLKKNISEVSEVITKINKFLFNDQDKHAIQSLTLMADYMINNKVNTKSIEAFIKLNNELLRCKFQKSDTDD